jgi:hypothetical protein
VSWLNASGKNSMATLRPSFDIAHAARSKVAVDFVMSEFSADHGVNEILEADFIKITVCHSLVWYKAR